MSRKNLIVLSHKEKILKNQKILKLYLDFKSKIKKLKSKKFLVAISGGADSLTLAAMCKIYQNEYKKTFFYYTNVNHNIRENSYKESKEVKKILKNQKILLKIINNKVKIEKNIQHLARKARYSLLVKECLKKKCNHILMGHHKDDQIETFLIRLSRGSGVKGLSSMKVISNINSKIKVFRPFLEIEKKILIYSAKKIFGKYIKDPSNSNDKYLRVKIRKILPVLINSGISKNQIIKSINNLRSSSETLSSYYSDIYKKIVKTKGKKIVIQKEGFLSLNKEIQINVLGNVLKLLKKTEYPPRAKKIENLLKILISEDFKSYSLAGCVVTQKDGVFVTEKSLKN